VQVFAATDPDNKDEKSVLFVGSGFLISKEGHILTNASIAYNADRIWIEHAGIPRAAEIIGQDVITNLSVLQLVKPLEGEPHVKLAETTQLPEVGSTAIAITRQMGLPPSPSQGMVTGHNIAFGNRPLPAVYLRVSIPSKTGEGGSPVFDLNGQLIGIMIATLPEIDSSFVLPTKAIRRIRDDIIFSGEVKYAWFGLRAHLEHGKFVIIDAIEPDGPAANSELKIGDSLISIGDFIIKSDSDLRDASFYTPPGQRVTVKVNRGEKEFEYSIEVGTRKPPSPADHSSDEPPPANNIEDTNHAQDSDATKVNKTDAPESEVTVEETGSAPPNPAPLKDDGIEK